ncbi:hypothetical protein [Hydrogenophaga sp.]|uniref:hypothetical protein n=1 Tax=Hydrogenophaga sp. TaxID=1904254 RepID=UPI003F71093B
MINLTSSTPVSWPTPSSTAVAPVTAVPAVAALPGGRETQTGPRSGREGAGHSFPSPAGERSMARAANPATPAGVPPQEAHGAGDFAAQATQRQEMQREAHAARERDQRAMEHLKEVLTSVWQASAAVVDRALGRESTEALPGSRSDTAPDLSQVAASLVARRAPVLTSSRPVPSVPIGQTWVGEARQDEPNAAEVVAYDEHGNSSLMPLEAGSHFSQRV